MPYTPPSVTSTGWLGALLVACGATAAFACGSTVSAPTPTTPTPAPSAPAPPAGGASVNLAGGWRGTGSDVQGPEQLALTIAQSGSTLSGSADMKPSNAADGSCASCHKFKTGTVSGSVNGTMLAMRLVFPAGGDGVPTPMCTITFEVTAAGVTGDRIAAAYSGDDSCEGSFTDGALTIARQP
jgi:hypothetical protein